MEPKVARSPVEIWRELVVAQLACDAAQNQMRLDFELGRGVADEEDINRLVRVRSRISDLLSELSYVGALDLIGELLAIALQDHP